MSTPVPPRGKKGKAASNRAASNRPAANRSSSNRPAASRPSGSRPTTTRAAATPAPPRGRQTAYQRRHRQRQLLFGGVGLVVVIVLVLVVVAVTRGSSGGSATAVPANILSQVEGVSPASMATQAKADTTGINYPVPITNAPSLTADGKPKIVYIGAEYCPYCGGERWALVMALSKFGTFKGLQEVTSEANDTVASVPSFSFAKATYTSPYLVFDPTETQTVSGAKLQTPTAANVALENKYDAAPYTSSSGIPFIDFANKWVIDGASYTVNPLSGLSHATVATAASTASTKYGADIQSVAGAITSRLCQLTGHKPANVCKYFPTVIGK